VGSLRNWVRITAKFKERHYSSSFEMLHLRSTTLVEGFEKAKSGLENQNAVRIVIRADAMEWKISRAKENGTNFVPTDILQVPVFQLLLLSLSPGSAGSQSRHRPP
jgi:hypothetical protein